MPPLVSDSYHGWQDVGRRPLHHTQVHCWFKLEFWNCIWNFKNSQIWKCAAPLPWSTSAALLKSRWQIMSRKMFEFHLLKSHLFLRVDYHIFILILPFSIFQLVLFLFFIFLLVDVILFSANVEIFSLHFDFFFGSEKALWPPGVATMPGRPWTGRNHHWTIATVSKRQVPFKLNQWQLINSKIRLHQTWLSSY